MSQGLRETVKRFLHTGDWKRHRVSRCATRRPLGICERLEDRRLLSGVTLIAHGYGSNINEWVAEMANAIGLRPDVDIDQPRYAVRVVDNTHTDKTDPLDVTIEHLSGPSPTDFATDNPEIMILLDWSDVAGEGLGGFWRSTKDVARDVASKLVDPDFFTDLSAPLAQLPMHLIGHSRGASLVGELAHNLGKLGIWVDQVTTHDPHPVDDHMEPWLGSWDFDDAPMQAWENVAFWDNYWRTDGPTSFDFTGEPIANTHDVELDENTLAQGGYSNEHSDVHLWYHGTIDTSPDAFDYFEYVPNDWYYPEVPLHPARDASGYYFSRIVDGTRPLDGIQAELGGQAVGDPIPLTQQAWPNVMEVAVAGQEFTIGEDDVPVTYLFQDADSSVSVTLTLDVDRNPYNSNPIPGETPIVLNSTTVDVGNGLLDNSACQAGTYYVSAMISDGTHTRYAYAPDPITMIASGPVNQPPVANAQTVSTAEDTALPITLTGEDGDPEVVQTLTFALETGPSHGILSGFVPSTGYVLYTPDTDYNGPDSFTFSVTDDDLAGNPPALNSAPATIAITVNAVNDVPLANTQTLATAEDTALPITLTGEDGDPEVVQTLTFALATGPSHGTLSDFDSVTGEVLYTPHTGYFGDDSFTFTVIDDASAGEPATLTSAAATVDVTVTAGGTGPIAADDFESGTFLGGTGWLESGWNTGGMAVVTSAGSPIGSYHAMLRKGNGYMERSADLSSAPAVLLSFSSKVVAFEDSDEAWVKVSPDGINWATVHVFTAADSNNPYAQYDVYLPGSSLSSTFYIAFDAQMNKPGDYWYVDDVRLAATETINQHPVANDDEYAIEAGDTLTVGASMGLLQNDTDVDPGDVLAVDSMDQTDTAGTVTAWAADGSFSYEPKSLTYTGVDSFTYTINDGNGGTATASVTIDVLAAGSQRVYTSVDRPFKIGDLKTVTSTVEATFDEPVNAVNVEINLSHAAPETLYISLFSPDGTGPLTVVPSGTSGLYGVAIPEGLQHSGIWTLQIYDSVKDGKRGTLYGWTLIVNPTVAMPTEASTATAVDAALLAWVDLDSSDDDESDILTETLLDDLALMLVE
jgi:Big-like domain-containing protein/proprotein convertase P-domain-containing protein